MIRRLAIVNRGEAAVRCLRTVRVWRDRTGEPLSSVALFTRGERDAPFVRQADEAVELVAKATPVASYLDHDVLLAAIHQSGADAVWPGWGFVAEDADFVERLEREGLTFLGPSATTMRRLGDKIAAKQLAEAAGVPVSPWNGGVLANEDEAVEAACRIGFPVTIKASAGGGGRGIRMVDREQDVREAYRSASSEAQSAFGDGRLFVEACITGGRHIEVQIAGDGQGNLRALGCRDCSVQRRHQKVLEEAPPPGLSDDALQALREAAVRLATEVGYQGVGTVEFLVQGDQPYFLEVNPRLQVEHGLTECLTGLDLVELQIRIARGESLAALEVSERGAAIEARVCAEDPAVGFLPAPGVVTRFDPAFGPGVRVDSGIVVGSEVSPDFDSLIAKVITHASSRSDALARLQATLFATDLVIAGGATNKGFLLEILRDREFCAGGVDTTWLERRLDEGFPTDFACERDAMILAGILAYQRHRTTARRNFFGDTSSLELERVPESSGQSVELGYRGRDYELRVLGVGSWRYHVALEDDRISAELRSLDDYTGVLEVGGVRRRVAFAADEAGIRVEVDGMPYAFSWHGAGRVRAVTPALVVSLSVAPGDRVRADEALGILEAMKMEIAFRAPISGVVKELAVRPGQQVRAGDLLAVLETSAAQSEAEASDRVSFAGNSSVEVGARERIEAVLLGYDIDPIEEDGLLEVLETEGAESFVPDRREVDRLRAELRLYLETEELFLRAPGEGGDLSVSNHALLRRYVRRIGAGGAGLEPRFLARLEWVLKGYGISVPEPGPTLERAILRLFAARRSAALRHRLAHALVRRLEARVAQGPGLRRHDELSDTLTRIAALRGHVPEAIADAALEAHHEIFDAPRLRRRLARAEREAEESPAMQAALARMQAFDLERLPSPPGLACLHARARNDSGDERIFVVAEVRGRRHREGKLTRLHLAAFESAFHDATRLLRTALAERDPRNRLQWNRIFLIVHPEVALGPGVIDELVSRLAPATRRLGLEKVIVRFSRLDPEDPEAAGKWHELVVSDLTGNRLEIELRQPRDAVLEPQTPYERRVAEARRRNLLPPHEVLPLFGDTFEEFDLDEQADEPTLQSVRGRQPGDHEAGLVVGLIGSVTEEVPEGMERVAIVSDPTREMGALASAECDRVVAALDLAEQRDLPVEWIPISAGARISMESGTENLDATARVVRRIVKFTQAGGTIHVVVAGVNVGAQSYWDALATMQSHCRGALIMTPEGSMVLTGRAALEASGSVAAEDEIAIGGYERVSGPNGEAQYFARDLAEASRLLHRHYRFTYVVPGEKAPRPLKTEDPPGRDVGAADYAGDDAGFSSLGELFDDAINPGRKKPFAMRELMAATADSDTDYLERWRDWEGAETAIVWDASLGGKPICLLGMESRNLSRLGPRPLDGPAEWTGGTLFPNSSRKVARALEASSGNRPAVVLANLSGFDGSPESMRNLQLEFGADIARAVVNFEGPILFLVVSRYHGGAYVVFSQELNSGLRAAALEGAHASVIGGAAAAQVVFGREVENRARRADTVRAAEVAYERSPGSAASAARDRALSEARLEARLAVAAEFDAIHSVDRAREVGSLHDIVSPSSLRGYLIDCLADARRDL